MVTDISLALASLLSSAL